MSARRGRSGTDGKRIDGIPWRKAYPALRAALREDIGRGDFTSLWMVGAADEGSGALRFKEQAVVAGLEVAHRVWRFLDADAKLMADMQDGSEIEAGAIAATVQGKRRALLTGERTALNFLQRMSGIATLTRRFVIQVEGTGVKILDTRKTAPGLRIFDRYAVRVGGGVNHREGLWDMVLLKSNHMIGVAGPKAAFERVARRNTKRLPVEIEVRDIEEFSEALGLPVARIMLDNMSVGELRQAVALAHRMNDGRRLPLLEASGGITLANVRAIAETGVDLISVGALTHSVEAIDVSFTIHE